MRQTARYAAAVVLALLTSFALGPSPAVADPLPGQDRESRLLSDRLNVTVGGYRPEFSTDVAAGFGGPIDAFINAERTLGLQEDLSVFRLGGFYRVKPRHAIDWTFAALNRDGLRMIDEDIVFGDPPMEFRVDAEVGSKFHSSLFAVNYKYSFINNGKVDAGVSAGLFTYDYDLELRGQASAVGDIGGSAAFEQVSARVLAPLPALGMFINYAVRKNVIFRGEVKFLSLDFGDFTGKFSDTLFTLDWYFVKHVGIGIGASRTSIDFRDRSDDPFTVDYSYGGFLGYLSLVF